MKVILETNGALLFDVEDLPILSKGIPIKWHNYDRKSGIYKADHQLEFHLISEDQLKFTETDTKEDLKIQLAAKQKAYDASNTAQWKAQEELKKLKIEIETLKSACPKPVEIQGTK